MNVTAIIVVYQVHEQTLRTILDCLRDQCGVIIADNSPTAGGGRAVEFLARQSGVCYVSMHGNSGIGAAQNTAAQLAWTRGAEAVLLLDDDSIPPSDIVARLVACAEALGRDAVVGANAVDDNGIEISNVKGAAGCMPECREMMSSGALIRREIFDRVGPFDESLFIDGVDFDWGWRARKAGFALFVSRGTAIRHRLGEGRVVGIGLPSPVRHYFQFRNVLRLMVRSHTPWRWRISQAIKLPTKLFVIALFMPERAARLSFAFAGVKDAIRGHHGPLPLRNDLSSSLGPQ